MTRCWSTNSTCITRRCQLARGPVKLNLANAITDEAAEHWLDGQSAVIIGGSGAYSVYSPEIQHQVARLLITDSSVRYASGPALWRLLRAPTDS